MNDRFHQSCFQIHEQDNVCTALSDLRPGAADIRGNGSAAILSVAGEVPRGHKLAVCFVKDGDPIIKFGVTIAIATRDIQAGEWVHLHNCRSRFDERSSTLDLHSGAPTDIMYE